MLPNTLAWYLLKYHQRYSLYYSTHAFHASTPTTLPTLARYPCNPRQHVIYVTHANKPPTLARIARHFSNSLVRLFDVFKLNFLKHANMTQHSACLKNIFVSIQNLAVATIQIVAEFYMMQSTVNVICKSHVKKSFHDRIF